MKVELSKEELLFLIKALVMTFAESAEDFNIEIIGGRSGTREGILGKLFQCLGREGRDYYKEASRSSTEKNRISSYLFMGNGNLSLVLRNRFFKRLNYAIHESGVIQQIGRMGIHCYQKEYDKVKSDIALVVLDLMGALDISVEDILKHTVCSAKKSSNK